jgi:hypothetical protein
MENGQLSHLIQNPESADPEQLDALIEKYPAISLLKILKLKSMYEKTGIIDQPLWDQLLIEWPDKKSLLKLKSVGFDPNKIMEIHPPQTTQVLEQIAETENNHITDSLENLLQMDHLGFIYEMPPNLTPLIETQQVIVDNAQSISNDSHEDSAISEPVSIPPSLSLNQYFPHVGFIYEYDTDQSETSEDELHIADDISPELKAVEIEEVTSPDIEDPQIEGSDDEPLDEEDSSLSAYVNWLKALNKKQHFNTSDQSQLKTMKKKSKQEKPDKEKEDRKDRSKTAKKLLKKSKKMHKDIVKKQEKSKKKSKKKSELSTVIEGSLKKSPTVITETYADLLAKQGYIDQSIEMFEKLSLLNPEKSTYFAAKILKLKNN